MLENNNAINSINIFETSNLWFSIWVDIPYERTYWKTNSKKKNSVKGVSTTVLKNRNLN